MPECAMYFCLIVYDQVVLIGAVIQGFTNPGCQVAQETKFCILY
jgi:6,7-dimethyl-8-ribityllumazine synthase